MFGRKWIVLYTVLAALALLAAVTVYAKSVARPTAPQVALGTGFIYQGQLKSNGNPVTGDCDMAFRLYDDDAPGGSQVGAALTTTVPVTDGLFSVQLDFGTGGFTGEARWLGIQVMCPGDAAYTDLGRQPLAPAPYALALPGLWTQQNGTSPNLIGGYSGNVISDTVTGGTIGGGGYSGQLNRVTANFATIGGGYGNTADQIHATIGGGVNNIAGNNSTVGGGNGNDASGGNATICGGDHNVATGTYSTVGGGEWNVASGVQRATVGGGGKNTAGGSYSTVGGGASNTASGSYATVAGGWAADASHFGETAHASGWFEYPGLGQAQASEYVLRRTTTSGTTTELFLDGDTATQRLTIASGRTVAFDILVVARTESGNSAGYRFLGVIENQGGVTSLVGSPQKTVLGENVASWDANVVANNTYDALVIQVTGASGTPIRWVAAVRTAEVGW